MGKMNWGGAKIAGDVCPSCWSSYQSHVREDCRSQADQAAEPIPEAWRTLLICACDVDADMLSFYGFGGVYLTREDPTNCEIELGNDAMKTQFHVKRAIDATFSAEAEERPITLGLNDSQTILDINGNAVGKWHVSDRDGIIQTKFGESIG